MAAKMLDMDARGMKQAQKKLSALERSMKLLDGYSTTVTSDSDHVGFVIGGTKPHVIEPRNARALFWPGARHPVRRVFHPGTAPNPFVEDALDARQAEMENRAVGVLSEGFDRADRRSGQQAQQLAANVLLGDIRHRAPVGKGPTSGSLRDSFRVTIGRG